MAKGYCTAADVESFLGVTFTAAQTTAANAQIARVEAYLDNAMQRSWLDGAVANETFFAPFRVSPPSAIVYPEAGYAPVGADLFLAKTPVVAVNAVKALPFYNGDEQLLVEGRPEDTPVKAGATYEIRDLTTGWLRLIAPSFWYRIRVDYTPLQTVPLDVTQAAIELAATWMQPSLNQDTWGIDSYQLPDLSVKFARGRNDTAVPASVQNVIDTYRFRVTA